MPPDTSPPALSLVTAKPDALRAEEFKYEIRAAMEPLLATLTRAKLDGFDIQFSIGADAWGNSKCQVLKVLKEF